MFSWRPTGNLWPHTMAACQLPKKKQSTMGEPFSLGTVLPYPKLVLSFALLSFGLIVVYGVLGFQSIRRQRLRDEAEAAAAKGVGASAANPAGTAAQGQGKGPKQE